MENRPEFDVEQIVKEYSDMVYRMAMIYGRTKEDTEDIFQEVFLRLVQSIHKLESREHIRNWLIRVTVNCGKTHRRKMMKQQTLPLNDEWGEALPDGSSEMEWRVYTAVRSLPPTYRSIIHLYYYEELSIKEISQCLKRKEGTVKSQLARGRALLGRKLGEEFDNETIL
ncbi:MAG: sigma-70 family RNA polymerase sigma factor [Clostridium sp.]|nr:sigma-70 family RNA polymerase sigma factor [Clostridium sp.]